MFRYDKKQKPLPNIKPLVMQELVTTKPKLSYTDFKHFTELQHYLDATTRTFTIINIETRCDSYRLWTKD